MGGILSAVARIVYVDTTQCYTYYFVYELCIIFKYLSTLNECIIIIIIANDWNKITYMSQCKLKVLYVVHM